MYDFTQCCHCRDAYAEMLVELGRSDKNIVVLDSDLSGSTKTILFKKAFPDRFFDIGIAEQNLIDVAAGLALSNKIPFLSTFAIFGCGRGWEQIRNMVALDNLTVNMVMTHAGLSLGGDGATHQSLEDIAIMRAIPNMQVYIPSDCTETREIIRFAAGHSGPKFIRLSRRRTVRLFDRETYRFDPDTYPVLEDGDDISIFASGGMIRPALMACYDLKKAGISARVINIHTIKPISANSIVTAARETGCVLSVEEHNVLGGIGSAIAEVLIQEYPVKMKILGVRDTFGGSGPVDELMVHLGLTKDTIVESVKNMVK